MMRKDTAAPPAPVRGLLFIHISEEVAPKGLLCGGGHDTGALPLPVFRRHFGTFAAPTMMRKDTAAPPRPCKGRGRGRGVGREWYGVSPSPPFPKEGQGWFIRDVPTYFQGEGQG